MSMAGVVSLDVMAIHKTLDCYGLPYDEDRLTLIDKVQYLSSVNIGFRNAAAKPKK